MMLISTKQICVGWDGGPEVLEMVLHVRDNTKELFANISARLPYICLMASQKSSRIPKRLLEVVNR